MRAQRSRRAAIATTIAGFLAIALAGCTGNSPQPQASMAVAPSTANSAAPAGLGRRGWRGWRPLSGLLGRRTRVLRRGSGSLPGGRGHVGVLGRRAVQRAVQRPAG